jgi:hypothetical protein
MSDEQLDLAAIDREAATVPSAAGGMVEPDKSAKPAELRAAQLAPDELDHFSLIFRDGLDMPIGGLDFIATFPSGLVCTAASTADGAIALPWRPSEKGTVKVAVKDASGKKQEVCSIDLAKCNGAVIVRSPKTKAKLALQPHQQVAATKKLRSPAPAPAASAPSKSANRPSTVPKTVDPDPSWWSANGALQKAWAWITSQHYFDEASAAVLKKSSNASPGLSSAGQPVSAVMGPEAPNKDNLKLGRNNIYREPILEAAKRLGLNPQALCALMDCEAGKVSEKLPVLNPDGSPAKDKKGKPKFQVIRERWNAQAGNAESGAAGLTQFLASTWLAHALLPSYYIHEKSVANGWVKQATDAKGKTHWAFVLEDGSTTTAPYKKRSDSNVKKCLAMRMDPAWSINAAADYGNANLKVLEKAGFKLSGLNDMDKAKLMYLMHHEGEGAGPLFVRNSLKSGKGGVAALRRKFELQLGSDGESKVDKLVDDADGDVEVAYRHWFSTYVDKQFTNSGKYFFSSPVLVGRLSILLVTVGGNSIEEV